MNVNELMIGDWVRDTYHDKIVRWNPRKWFIEINDHLTDRPAEGRDYEPIPLTHEVVAQVATPSANGYWELTPSLYIEGDTLWCTLEPKSEMITHYRDDLEYLDFLSKETFYEKVCDINYVHELQHILKTLHIDKEIQL